MYCDGEMSMTQHHPAHVVIVGGGISGLGAAWYIEQQARESGVPVRVTVLEAGTRWGGKIQTDTIDGLGDTPFVVEGGPDSFLTQKPAALGLARELGLSAELLGTNDRMRHVFVLNRGKPVKLPDGVLLIVPTKFMPFALSPLISPLGKLRMGCDLFIPRRRDERDETLADFVRRRLGTEALDKIAEPLMSGIYNAEAERQSLLATFPRFRQLEREHGSLVRGMLASRRRQPAAPPNAPKTALFMSLRAGTQVLVDTLVSRLGADLRLNSGVTALARTVNAYTLTLTSGEQMDADAVILTAPAHTTADLVHPFAPEAAAHLKTIRYVSTGTISLAFRAADLPRPLSGFGVVIPNSERRPINAITISSTKFDGRAPEGYVLLRVFFGGSRSPHSMALHDEALLATVRGELSSILGIEATPLFHRIYRWHEANPQYDLDHLERVDAIERALPLGLHIAGSAYRGVGLPDCIASAQTAARAVLQTFAASGTLTPA
jgi:oxygen-dependent protoporphyrinogen oxidase